MVPNFNTEKVMEMAKILESKAKAEFGDEFLYFL